jgi:hypothetical protein
MNATLTRLHALDRELYRQVIRLLFDQREAAADAVYAEFAAMEAAIWRMPTARVDRREFTEQERKAA